MALTPTKRERFRSEWTRSSVVPTRVDVRNGHTHAVGRRDKVMPMAPAIGAAGGDGLVIEVHHAPTKQSATAQSLYPDQYDRLMDELRIIVPAVGRRI